MSLKSSEIKQYFKKLGIPVRVRTVACKHPFAQIWIESEKTAGFGGPIIYKYEFPLELRVKLLKIIYGENFEWCERGNAGNVRPNSISVNENEWRKLIG